MFPLMAIFDKEDRLVDVLPVSDLKEAQRACNADLGEYVRPATLIENEPTNIRPPVTMSKIEAWGAAIYELYDTDGERYLFSCNDLGIAEEVMKLLNSRIYCPPKEVHA